MHFLRFRAWAGVLPCLMLGMAIPVWAQPNGVTSPDQSSADPAATSALAADEAALLAALAADASPTVADSATAPQLPAMPDIALILDVAGGWFSDRNNLQNGGHDPTRTGFNLQQLELHLQAQVDPYLRMAANIVWGPDGVELEEAFAQSTALPGNLAVRAGKFLNPFGRLNPTHPHAWQFLDAPFALTKLLGPDGSRGIGSEVSWLAPLPWFFEVRVAANHPDEDTGRSFVGEGGKTVSTVRDLVWTGNLRQFFPLGEDWSLYWGLSTQQGTGPQPQTDMTQIYGTDLYLRWRPVADPHRSALSLQVEALWRRRQWVGQRLDDWTGYAQLIRDESPHWSYGMRMEYGSGVTDDPLDPAWVGPRSRTSLQVTYLPSHFARLRLQASVDRPTWRPEPIYAVMLGLETVIGAHGAHAY